MIKILKYVLIISFCTILFITGYFYIPVSNNVYFEENKKITLLIYGEGNIINKKTYPPKSNFHKKLNKWLKTNSHGWHHSPASFAPSVYIISENISLNLRENSAVLNYKKSNDKYVQLITTINNSRFFDKLNKNILAH